MATVHRYDTVVVGAGTAGCVVANRLSVNPDETVVLVEAGPDFGLAQSGAWPPSIAGGDFVPTSFDWGYRTSINGQALPYVRGKVVGGSSAINANGINWGLRRDYDEWETLGNSGWGFESLLPYFHKVERLENDDAPYRGRDGMLVVNRMRDSSPFFDALAEAYRAAGHEEVRDVSGPEALQGYGLPTRNVHDNIRFHSAAAYLDPARGRQNLTVLPGTELERICWRNGKVVSLVAIGEDGPFTIEAERIVLAGGAIGTPLVLQRSGIGPEALLQRVLGKDQPIVDLPGVGRNLRDHFGSTYIASFAEGAYDRLGVAGEDAPTRVAFYLRHKSRPDLDAFDLDVLASYATRRPERHADETFEYRVFLIRLAAEGRVEIAGPDVSSQPFIETGMDVESDFEALARGFEWVRECVRHDAVRPWLGSEVAPGSEHVGPALRDYLRRNVRRYSHPCGTTKMGQSSDPMAVVDTGGKVYGFDNLYVADASIFPTIPRGMINLTVYAAAEKIAEQLAL